MRFNYQYFEGKFLPIIPLKLRGSERWFEFNTYLDSGASYSLFHADIAEILGIDLQKGRPEELTIGDGDKLKVILHGVFVNIAGKEYWITVGFSKELGTGFNILGRRDIFEKFIICFHEKDRFIEFKEEI